jgi:tRNA (mo5U34)-methyltransferase
MTPDEKRAGVDRLGPWFHRIDLGDGVVTKGASVAGEAADHPLPTWQHVAVALPADLSGRSVLDVGCNAGFYSVEAKRLGAERVLGIDAQRHQVRQASFVARALGLDLEFRRMSVYDLSPETVGIFDVTLALGLVYHLKHLVQGLERLFSVTRDLLVLETAVLLPELVPTEAVPYVTGDLTRRLHPMGYVQNSADAKEAVYNWFVPSVGAISAMLSDTGFEDVRCVATPGDRAVFVCRKPRAAGVAVLPDLAGRLEVVSAPETCRLGEEIEIAVRASNTGRSPWRSSAEGHGTGAVALGAHLFRGVEEVDWAWARTELPAGVPPGGSVGLALRAAAPLEPGAYRVELDLVAEHLAWFEDLGSPLVERALEVASEPPPLPWFRVAGLEEGAATRGAGLAAGSPWAEVVRAAAGALASLPVEEQARLALLWTCGWSPEESAVADVIHALSAGSRLPGVLHGLAGRPDGRPVPPSPSPEDRTAELLGRAPAAPAAAVPLCGESFSGEAAVARGLLDEGSSSDDETFVRRAYAVVLGRAADEDALANATRLLAAGKTTRTHLLHELLWSDELRSA